MFLILWLIPFRLPKNSVDVKRLSTIIISGSLYSYWKEKRDL